MLQVKIRQSAAVILVDTPEGIILVKDPSKSMPHLWKMPGGKSKEGETFLECAVRELFEKTGLVICPESLQLVAKNRRKKHTHYVFKCTLSMVPILRKPRIHGEKIKIIPIESLKMHLVEESILFSHAKILNDYVS